MNALQNVKSVIGALPDSTAVPNCAGKGVIDLMLVYASGELTRTAAAVDALGFQAFSSARQPFPVAKPQFWE